VAVDPAALRLTVWGARGTLPVAPSDPTQFGTQTCCVQVEAEGRHLVFDAGTGIVPLGNRLIAQGVREIDLFLSHPHYDHVMGLFYFAPFHYPDVHIRIHSAPSQDGQDCRAILASLLRPPFHPVGLEKFRARVDYLTFQPGAVLRPSPGTLIATHPLHHPGGAVAFRVEARGRSLVYATDHEHEPGLRDPALERFLAGADILVFDTTFTDAEMPLFKGYGHASHEEGVRLAKQAGIGRLVLFHHSHKRADADLLRIEREARHLLPGAIAGRPGLEIALPARVETAEA